jgi:DNA-binding beta-propeller fold protein YncE
VLEPPVDGVPVAEENDRRRLLVVLGIITALLVLIAAVFAWYLITRKPLTDLPGLNREAMPAFSYSIYGVTQPLGVAVSDDGERVYVTQSGGKRTVVEFDHRGNLLATFSAPKNSKVDHIPVYIASTPPTRTSTSRTAARLGARVHGRHLPQDGQARQLRARGSRRYRVRREGNLFITEVGAAPHRIVVLDASDKVVREIVPQVPMSFPNGIAVDGEGNVFVADSNNGRLVGFDAAGRQLATVNRGIGDGDLGLPRGVAVDNDGRITVIDTTNQSLHVYRLTEDGDRKALTFAGAAGDEGIADGLFEYPNGVATDSRSNVYITDRENGRVQVWSY